jgi:hypothetical protein
VSFVGTNSLASGLHILIFYTALDWLINYQRIYPIALRLVGLQLARWPIMKTERVPKYYHTDALIQPRGTS